MSSQDLICIGIISSPHGVHGLVKVKSYSDNPKGVLAYGDTYNEIGEKIKLDFKGTSKQLSIFAVKGINDRNDANQIKGQKLFIKRESLPKLSNGEVYHVDIIGLCVKDLENEEVLGEVKNILNYGAGDILEISSNNKEILIPLLSNDIENINFEKKVIKLSNIKKWKNIND